MMWKNTLITSIILVIVIIGQCQSEKSPPTTKKELVEAKASMAEYSQAENIQAENIRVAVIPPGFTSPFHVAIKDGAVEAAEKLGWTVDVVAAEREGDFAGQVTVVEQELQKGVLAIAVNPIDAKAIVTAKLHGTKVLLDPAGAIGSSDQDSVSSALSRPSLPSSTSSSSLSSLASESSSSISSSISISLASSSSFSSRPISSTERDVSSSSSSNSASASYNAKLLKDLGNGYTGLRTRRNARPRGTIRAAEARSRQDLLLDTTEGPPGDFVSEGNARKLRL